MSVVTMTSLQDCEVLGYCSNEVYISTKGLNVVALPIYMIFLWYFWPDQMYQVVEIF